MINPSSGVPGSVAAVVWDWNGTLLDDQAVCLRILNGMLARRGIPALTRDRYREVFGFPIRDYYRAAGFDLEREPFSILADEYVGEYSASVADCPASPGAFEALESFRSRGVPQILLTASDRATLELQLAQTGFAGYFSEIIAEDSIQTHGKAALARDWAAGKSPELLSRTVFIGDTSHDAALANEVGCRCVLVANGHQSRERLLKCSCAVIGSLRELAV